MKNKKKDLNEFLNENCKCFNKGSSLEKLFVGISEACKSVSLLTANGEISGVLGNLKSTNVQGEIQKKLDVLSNDIFIECFLKNEIASALISEENQDPIINKYNSSAPYVVYFDPLDGSSNIDVNGSVGSIFSIFEYSNNSNNMLIPLTGNFQIAACYAIYGPSTMFVLSLGSGTHGFTLDANSGKFLLTHPNLSVPEATHEYSINTSNERFIHNSSKKR